MEIKITKSAIFFGRKKEERRDIKIAHYTVLTENTPVLVKSLTHEKNNQNLKTIYKLN